MDRRDDPACQGCRNWLSQNGEMGECRRHAPRPLMDGHTVMTKPAAAEGEDDRSGEAVWPITFAGDFCGEFKDRPDVFRPSWARS